MNKIVPNTDAPRIELRLLETTDVHANLLAYDYYTNTRVAQYGLSRTATLIRQARREVRNCLLFDNGDFLQGTPLSDMTAQPGSGWKGPHPAVLAMNRLGYDAATLGNHEFNFGLEWLLRALEPADFPVTSTNTITRLAETADKDETLFPPYLILERRLTDTTGKRHRLRIGVLGLLPPQITTWDRAHLLGRITSRDIVETARARVPQIRAAGADIIVALAHTGMNDGPPHHGMENAALALACVPGIDAILAGHSHQVFPTIDPTLPPGEEMSRGAFNGTPAVMAGFRGSHLGVLDLVLRETASGWQVAAHRAAARPVAPSRARKPVPEDPDLCEALATVHAATLHLTHKAVGHTPLTLHSYLALLRCDPATRLVTSAQRAALVDALDGTPDASLPILSAAAPFKTGGRGGPAHYTDIPAGPLRLHHIADLYSFPNTLCGLRLTGARLRDWLERAAICFNRLLPGRPDQPLCAADVPGHDFDLIDGLTYTIDLSQPPRYDPQGRLVAPAAHRICDLRFAGKPLDDDAEFILATSNHRAFGGGPYLGLDVGKLVHQGTRRIRDLLADYLSQGVALPSHPVWHFVPLPCGTSAVFDTGPGLRSHQSELAALGACDTGDGPEGFMRLNLPMWTGAHVGLPCESVS